MNDRLMGTLAITRAFGDWNLKNKGLTSEPTVRKVIVKKGDTAVIATDGMWDVITDEVDWNYIFNVKDAFSMTSKM